MVVKLLVRLNPTIIAFPPYDREAWERGDRRTSPLALPIEKHVSQDVREVDSQ